MQFRHISAKFQPKNMKQHFDCGGGVGPLGPPWLRPWLGEVKGVTFSHPSCFSYRTFIKIFLESIF